MLQAVFESAGRKTDVALARQRGMRMQTDGAASLAMTRAHILPASLDIRAMRRIGWCHAATSIWIARGHSLVSRWLHCPQRLQLGHREARPWLYSIRFQSTL